MTTPPKNWPWFWLCILLAGTNERRRRINTLPKPPRNASEEPIVERMDITNRYLSRLGYAGCA